jgi:HPt (histidine-containing phosphotransfer) domain-containing protein
MDDYLSKPVRLDDLKCALDGVLRPAGESQSQAPAGKSSIPPVDPEAIFLLRSLRRPGKPDPVSELIDLFLEETPLRVREIYAGIRSGDREAVETSAHSLKGNASTLGALRLAGACGKVEEEAGNGGLERAEGLVQEIEAEFEEVRNALEREKQG